MPNYVRKNGDVKYRKVNIQSEVLPGYKDFTDPGESVQYTDMQVVEVLRADGATRLIHEPGEIVLHADGTTEVISKLSVVKVNATSGGPNRFLLDKNVPTHRVWMRRTDGTGVPYKVPAELPATGNSAEVRVPCGVQDMELFGDKYFEMIYHF